MKRVILPIIIFSLLFGSIGFAQETELPNPGLPAEGLPKAGLTPDNPFYFLDTLGEKIGIFFTFGAEKKAEKAIQYAGEKLAEIKAMAEANKIKALKKAGQKYQEYLALFFKKGEEAYEEDKDITELTERSKQRSLDYLIVLSDTHERISEEKAKAEIDNLRKVSREFFGETIWSIHEKQMKELREERKREEVKEQIEMLEKDKEEIIEVETTNWKIYRSEKYGFEIKYPRDWTKRETTDVVGFASPEKDSSLMVVTFDISTRPVTLDEYKQILINQCKTPECNIIDSSDTTLANIPAHKVVYAAGDPQRLAFMIIFTIKDNKLYSLTYQSTEFSKYLDIVNAMIASFDTTLGSNDTTPESKLPPKEQTFAVCEGKEKQASTDGCYRQTARMYKDSSICEKIVDQEIKDGCYRELGQILKDTSLCEKRINPDWCYKGAAYSYKDSSLCEKVVDQKEKDRCYRDLGELLKDSSLCEEIADQATKDGCYWRLGTTLKDSSLCEKVVDQETKNRCYRGLGVTADWKVYGNEVYRFELMYPGDLRYKKISDSIIEFAYPDQEFTDKPAIHILIIGNASISIEIRKSSLFANGYLAWATEGKIINKESEITINGEKFKQVDVVWRLVESVGARPEGTREIHTFIDKGGMIYDIVYRQLPTGIDKSEDYNRILSTFKFIK